MTSFLLNVVRTACHALWTGTLIIVTTAMDLLRPLVWWLCAPFSFLLFAATVVFAFLLKTPHMYEQRWPLIGVSIAVMLVLKVYDFVHAVLVHALTGPVAERPVRRAARVARATRRLS